MLQTIIQYGLDVWGFAAVSVLATLGLHVWLKRRERNGLGRVVRVSTLTVIALAILGAKLAGEHERNRLRDQLTGYAPTYAAELQLMGHAAINANTPPDDPLYLKMIAAQIRWEKANPGVADIYTFRRDEHGVICLIVDSETDYDHNGKYEGDRESRTPIGEKYADALPGFFTALDGQASFDEEPETDRWGTWVSAFYPMYDSSGRVEAAVGVDYDARKWDAAIEVNRVAALGLAGVLLTIVLSASAVVTTGRAEWDKRQRLQRELVDASRQAGMAEVATGVLHNFGNVLNNVNVSADVLTDRIRNSKVNGVSRAAGLIQQHETDLAAFLTGDAKGRMLPEYLAKLGSVLVSENEGLLEELANLNRSLHHVKRIVAAQQTFAKKVDIIESFTMAELVDEAVRLVPAEQRAGVTIDASGVVGPALASDRHQVLQVLTNLIANAVKAVRESEMRHVYIDTEQVTTAAGDDAISLKVIDSGCGIDAAAMGKLFTHGFTTRVDGHGFGLHHSAIAAQNLGGTLSAASDGPGRGATFTLTLPLVASTEGPLCPAV